MKALQTITVLTITLIFITSCDESTKSDTPVGYLEGYTYYSGTTTPVSGVLVSVEDEHYTTNADGYFILNNIPIGSIVLTATKEGYDQYQTTITIVESGNRENIHMTSALYTYKLYGTIIDDSQHPLFNVTVVMLNDDDTESQLQTTSDISGYYQIPTVPQGQRRIKFNKQNYQTLIAQIFISNADYEYHNQLLNKPGIPNNSYPENGSVDLPWKQSLTLSWNCTDPDGDELEYDVYFGSNNPPSQLISEGQSTTTLDLDFLLNETVYYWKIVVRDFFNNMQEGPIWNFTTENIFGSIADNDGNTYHTIKIGDQWWMAENLKVTHYRNNDAIPHLTSNSDWVSTSTGAYCSYDNDDNNVDTYGRLYNWYAVDDSRNLAPEGWHVPSYNEWQTLFDFLGDYRDAGGKMKEAELTHWRSPNRGATNESGFTALPGGKRYSYSGNYGFGGELGYFWSSTEDNNTSSWVTYLRYNSSSVSRFAEDKLSGFSIRCVRD